MQLAGTSKQVSIYTRPMNYMHQPNQGYHICDFKGTCLKASIAIYAVLFSVVQTGCAVPCGAVLM